MQQVSDPPSAAQVAQMLERLNNLADDVKEIKATQAEANRMLSAMVGVQRDVAHLDEKVRRLFELADERAPQIAAIDGRLRSLERWHKVMGAIAIASLGAVGWGVQRIEYLYKMDNRISMLELEVNRPAIEHAMTPEHIEPSTARKK
jgi:hypothetical protein